MPLVGSAVLLSGCAALSVTRQSDTEAVARMSNGTEYTVTRIDEDTARAVSRGVLRKKRLTLALSEEKAEALVENQGRDAIMRVTGCVVVSSEVSVTPFEGGFGGELDAKLTCPASG